MLYTTNVGKGNGAKYDILQTCAARMDTKINGTTKEKAASVSCKAPEFQTATQAS